MHLPFHGLDQRFGGTQQHDPVPRIGVDAGKLVHVVLLVEVFEFHRIQHVRKSEGHADEPPELLLGRDIPFRLAHEHGKPDRHRVAALNQIERAGNGGLARIPRQQRLAGTLGVGEQIVPDGLLVALKRVYFGNDAAGGQIDVDGARVHLHQLFGVGVELRDPALPLPQQGFHQIGARKGVGDDVLDLRGVAVDDVPGFFPFLKHTDVFQTEEEKITPQQTDQQDAEGIQDAPAVPAFPQDAGVERPSISVPYQSLHRHSSNALMRGKVLQADKHIL